MMRASLSSLQQPDAPSCFPLHWRNGCFYYREHGFPSCLYIHSTVLRDAHVAAASTYEVLISPCRWINACAGQATEASRAATGTRRPSEGKSAPPGASDPSYLLQTEAASGRIKPFNERFNPKDHKPLSLFLPHFNFPSTNPLHKSSLIEHSHRGLYLQPFCNNNFIFNNFIFTLC